MNVLVLDNTWQPNRVVSVERAVILLLTGKATPVSDVVVGVMRSPSTEVRVPAVILVANALRLAVHGGRAACSREGVFARDAWQCQFVIGERACNAHADSIDHLVPQSRGGDDSWTNLIAACRHHNGIKAARTMDEMHRAHGWSLRRQPVAPRFALRMLDRARIREIPASWAPFLGA